MGVICCSDRNKEVMVDADGRMLSVHEMKCEYPMLTIIKLQSIARGFLARTRIKNMHGYQCKVGIRLAATPSEQTAEELSMQRDRIRK